MSNMPAPPLENILDEGKIPCHHFYYEWKGHPLEHLTLFHDVTRSIRPGKPVIWLAGDSSLDNKYWVQKRESSDPAPEIYLHTLDTPTPKPDVAFWMNEALEERATCINSAVEESTLRDREGGLLEHDQFIRNHIRKEDVLIVSVGANDVALRPTTNTIRHMLQVGWLTSLRRIENGKSSSLVYFIKELFGDKVQNYIEALTARTKPRAVVVCMIYFPLEVKFGQKSWARVQLKLLGYDRWPGRIQAALRTMYEIGTKQIGVSGTEVIPCALFEVLDGKNPQDYTARVEPNREGGRKIATRFVELLKPLLTRSDTGTST
ncbi:hypothetical protein BS50DRAFT_143264 [Corynespora cassiicola Philippines]|uniref:SGNH hydrolase-type esterase domain-containing protein n=1 Tax=Corynespora cassiicola Philippines TaxID=1448308 RepID=A0A2T2N888_CORCC|nr:hypothetical protein BS50DRAFT_143264 [Corynespora cassiicola Philippines]